MFKKSALLFASTAMVASLAVPVQPVEASATEWYVKNDVTVSPHIYRTLLNEAQLAAYVHTGAKTNLYSNSSLPVEVIYPSGVSREKHVSLNNNDYIIVKDNRNFEGIQAIITKSGSVIAYNKMNERHHSEQTPRKIEEFAENVARIFVETPPLTKVNFLNFNSLQSNKLLSTLSYNMELTVPMDATIDLIEALDYMTNDFYSYPVSFLHPGQSYKVESRLTRDTRVDGYLVDNVSAYNLNVSYTSSEDITTNVRPEDVRHIDLVDKFKISATDMPVSQDTENEIIWAVKKGLLGGYSDGSIGSYKSLTEAQFLLVMGRYYGHPNFTHDEAYAYFRQYNVPLKGHTSKNARNQPISRGLVAQMISATQGGPSSEASAIRFLMDNELTKASSVSNYNAKNTLKRAHVASFFKRMNDNNLK